MEYLTPIFCKVVMTDPVSVEANVEIIVVVAAGLFSLLGAFMGATLSKRNEYVRWLRENRSEVFAKFLELLHQAQKHATDAMFDKALEEMQQNIKVTEAYSPALEYAHIVCLYLPKNQRDNFRTLAKEFYALHATRGLDDTSRSKMSEKIEAIQKIFESNL
jgi:hypothetical protein